MAQLCKFFAKGGCNRGQDCRFIHPGQRTLAGDGSNTGGVFGNNAAFGNPQPAFGPTQKIDPINNLPPLESIKSDLTERPMWILSSYGPGKDPPAQLIDGKDISPEEARLMAYKLLAQGNPGAYEAEWIRLNTEADAQIRNILNDLPGAINFLRNAAENGGNSQYKIPGEATNAPALTQSTSAAFGQPQQSAPAFGQPAFAQPSQTTSTFGTPSPFAARQTPAFGQPSFGQPTTTTASTFAQPSASSASAFGQPGPASSTPAFGQPAFGATPQPQSALGRPAFGQPAFGQPAFGQPATLGQSTSAFSTTTTASPFSQPSTQQSAFGQSSAFGANAPKPAFGQPAFPQSAFGQSAFGKPTSLGSNASPFSAQAPSSSPFVQTQQNKAAATPFAATQQAQPQNQSPFSNANPFQQGQVQTQANNPFQAVAPAPQETSQPTSAFGQPSVPVSTFGVPQTQSSPFSRDNPFQSGQQQASGPAVPHQINPQLQEKQRNKKWDDPVIEYTQMEIEAFAAPAFQLGNIPLVAPSRQMCWGC
ncbi:hypothetical protein RUND412_009780 [Rhizina undulata]